MEKHEGGRPTETGKSSLSVKESPSTLEEIGGHVGNYEIVDDALIRIAIL